LLEAGGIVKDKFGVDINTTPPGDWRYTINGKLKKSYCIRQLAQWAKDAGDQRKKDEIFMDIVAETMPHIPLQTRLTGFIAEGDIPICDKNIYVMLGRAGDILCILPAMKEEADRIGRPVKMVVAAEFKGLLDGCSYIEPIVFEKDFRLSAHAYNWAVRKFPEYRVINCAVCAEDMRVDQKGWSFDRDIWINTKIPIPPHSKQLLFDNRDAGREEALKKQYISFNKKNVLLALEGHSSPFFWGHELKQELAKRLPDVNFVDISAIRAARLYDLLGLYDAADALIAIDSAPLHLAAASTVNTIALVTDQNTLWHQSSWKPHHKLRIPYSDVIKKIDDIISVISTKCYYPAIHLVRSCKAEVDPETQRRLVLAHKSVNSEEWLSSGWNHIDFKPTKDGTSIGDAPVPFIRDMIEQAYKEASPRDIICIANADIGFVPGITGEILDACYNFGSCYAQRHDFRRIDRLILNEVECATGRKYPGADLFAFTKEWWDKRNQFFPDMLLGREAWDMIMRDLVRSTGGVELHNAIYHEMHDSHWLKHRACAGNEHNKRLASAFLAANGRNWW
jgi:hypothetical protein